MATCKNETALNDLELPTEFEDLEGLLRADLRAMVVMLTQRANERLILTRREHHQLRATLWNNLTAAINGERTTLAYGTLRIRGDCCYGHGRWDYGFGWWGWL